MSRDNIINTFLNQHLGDGIVRQPLAGDASFRRYERVHCKQGKCYVLMDAPPEKEDVRPFIAIGSYLGHCGYSAPEILAEEPEDGLLLLEDLGDNLYSRHLHQAPQDELLLYEAAVDVLADLAERTLPAKLKAYDRSEYLRETSIFSEWFLPLAGIDSNDARATFDALCDEIFSQSHPVPSALVLRDYHADNLLWLPERARLGRVGLLDFQDALHGPVTYDLVSLLEDARRDVSLTIQEAMKSRFAKALALDDDAFQLSYALLGAQRNLKIIGIFSRLTVRDGKQQYLDYLPRVWRYLEQDMAHPLLVPLKRWLDTHVPQPIRQKIANNRQRGA